jgi:type II secretion system protein I
MTLSPPRLRRPGLSLLEVIVALGIFLLSLIAIGRLVSFGGDRALDVEYKTRATELALSKMDEIVAGIYPPSNGGLSDQPFDEDPDWHWTMSATQSSLSSNLWQVSVQVSYQPEGGNRVEMSVDRLVFDPTKRGTAANTLYTPAPSGGGGSSGSRGGSSSSGSTASSSGSAGATGARGTTGTSPAAGGRSGGTAAPAGGRSGGGTAPARGGGAAPAAGGRSGGMSAPASGGRSGGTGSAGKP